MNIPRYERNQQFERMVALKSEATGLAGRVVPADEWTPDTSLLGTSVNEVHVSAPRPTTLWKQAANEEFRKQTEDWYRGHGSATSDNWGAS